MLMGNTWTHQTSAQLVAHSLVHREAEGPSHTVGDVSALSLLSGPHPTEQGASLSHRTHPWASLSRVPPELIKSLFSDRQLNDRG